MTGNEIFSGEIRVEPVGMVKNDTKQPPLVAGEDGLHLNAACNAAVEKMGRVQEQVSEIVLLDRLLELS